ncbi:MAG: hypothetical protein K6A96_06915 [Prevotella sp.]|nr:hypothetical protein [Prevotella sp.]
MRTTRTTIYRRPTAARWLCLLLVLLGGVISTAHAQTRDVITFTGGHEDPNNPSIYVIDAGNVPATIYNPESYEWSNVEEYFTVTLRRTNTAHAATITLKDPVGHGEILVEFPAGVSEKTVNLNQTIEPNPDAGNSSAWSGYVPTIYTVSHTSYAESQYQVLILKTNRTGANAPRACTYATHLECLQNLQGFDRASYELRRFGEYVLIRFKMSTEVKVSADSRLVMDVHYTDHTGLSADADDYGMSKTREVSLTPINANSVCDELWYLYKPSEDEFLHSYYNDGRNNKVDDDKCIAYSIREVGPIEVANPAEGAVQYMFFSRNDLPELNSQYFVYGGRSSFMPHFSNASINKTSVNSGEALTITATMDNWQFVKRAQREHFMKSFGVTFDGGETSVPCRATFDETTGRLTCSFNAPTEAGTVDVALCSKLTDLYYGPDTIVDPGCFFAVNVASTPAEAIPAQSLTLEGLPAEGSIVALGSYSYFIGDQEMTHVDNMKVPLTVSCYPANATDANNVTYSITNENGATAHFDYDSFTDEPINDLMYLGETSGKVTVTATTESGLSASRSFYVWAKAPRGKEHTSTYLAETTFPLFQFEMENVLAADAPVTVNYTHLNGTQWTATYQLKDLKKHPLSKGRVLYDLPFSFTEEHPNVSADGSEVGQAIVTAQVLMQAEDANGNPVTVESVAKLVPDLRMPSLSDFKEYEGLYNANYFPTPFTSEVMYLPKKGFSVGYEIPQLNLRQTYSNLSGDPVPDWLTLEENGLYYTAQIKVQPEIDESNNLYYFYTMAQRSYNPEEAWRYELTSITHLSAVDPDAYFKYRVNDVDVTGDLTFDNTATVQEIIDKCKEDGFYAYNLHTDTSLPGLLNYQRAFFQIEDDFFHLGADLTVSCENKVIQTIKNFRGNLVFEPPMDGRTYTVEVYYPGYDRRYKNTFVNADVSRFYTAEVQMLDYNGPVIYINHFIDGEQYDIPIRNTTNWRLSGILYMQNPDDCFITSYGGTKLKCSVAGNLYNFNRTKYTRTLKPELKEVWLKSVTTARAAFNWAEYVRLGGLAHFGNMSSLTCIWWSRLTRDNTFVEVVNSRGQHIENATVNYACVDASMTQTGAKGTATYNPVSKQYQVPTSHEQYAEFFEAVADGYKPTLVRMNLWDYDYNSVYNAGKPRRLTIVMNDADEQLNSLTLETPKRSGNIKDGNVNAYMYADNLLMIDSEETLDFSQTAENAEVTKHIQDPRFGTEGWSGKNYAHVTGLMTYASSPNLKLSTANGSIQLQPEMKYITPADFSFTQNYCLFDFDLTNKIEDDAKLTLKNGTTTLAALPTLHNYDLDLAAMNAASETSLDFDSPELTEVDNQAEENGVDMKDSGKAFDKFNFQLPPVLPFTVNIERDGDHFIIRACMEKNFLPGGEIMDALDALGDYQYFDEQFQACMDAVNTAEPADDDFFEDIPRWPSAFVGIKGYLSGIGYYDRENGKFEFTFLDGGIVFEASAAAQANLSFGIGSFGMSIDAKMAMTLGLVNTAAEMGDVSAASTKIDFVFDYQAHLKVCAWAYAGIDIWIAKAVAGVRGGACFDLHHRAYVSKGLAGMKTTLQAKMEAFAEARFLFWSVKKTWPIFDVYKEYLVPNKPSNPFHPANPEPMFTMTRQNVTKNYKKLKRKVIADLSGTRIISDINGMARPTYLSGGQSLLFYNLNTPKEYNDDRIQMYSNGNKEDVTKYGVDGAQYDFSVAKGGTTEVLAYEQIKTEIDKNELEAMNENAQIKTISELTDICVSVRKNGGNWSDQETIGTIPTMGCVTPAVAVQNDGKAAVIWQQGVAKFNEEGSRYIDGSLMLSRYNGEYWDEPIEIKRIHSRSVPADYQVSMKEDSVLVMMTLQQDVENDEKQASVVYVSISPDDKVRERFTLVEGVKPQMIHVNGANLVGYIKSSENGRDIVLSTVNMKGEPTGKLSGSLDMNKRTVSDFKLVADDEATDLEDVGLLWSQSDQESTDNGDGTTTMLMKNRVYASKLCSHDKGLYFSTPVEVATMPDGVTLASMDGHLNDRDMKVAYCVTNKQDGGAVIENSFTFDNAIDHKVNYNAYEVNSAEQVPVTITVANNGFQPIGSIDVTMKGETTTHEVLVMPQEKTNLTAFYPVDDNFDGTIDYDVTANFVAGNSNALKARRKAPRSKAPRRTVRQSGTQVDVRQVDMALKILSKKTDADGATTIVAEVNNASLLPLASDMTVKVGLYNSPIVDENAVSLAEVTVNASDLYDASADQKNKVKIVSLTVTQPDVSKVLYLRTTPMQGSTVLTDVRPSNNVLPISLVGKFKLGDTNHDTLVNMTDAQNVVNTVLGKPTTGTFYRENADVSREGDISISDAVGIVNIILNEKSGSAKAKPQP